MNNPPLLRCAGVRKSFRLSTKVPPLPILQGVDFVLAAAERVAVVGASGSGKSTLLTLMGGLDQPDEGEISLQGNNWQKMNEARCNFLRNRALGFIYQHHHLLDEFSALENVAMPLYIRRMNRAQAEAKATEMLARVGLAHRLDHRPGELSGGERQRVAVARSLVTEPACVLADEPTGNLDRINAEAVFALLLELNRERGCALVVVTHDERLAAQTQRQLQLIDGKLRPLNENDKSDSRRTSTTIDPAY